jgi:ketosteroid isomerase-like protein
MIVLIDQDILAKAYRAFNARDIDAVLAYLHPNVDWPNGMEGGRVHGHKGVRDYWTRQWNLLDPHVEPTRFSMEEDGRVTVEVHQVVRSLTGDILGDQVVQHVYLMQEGLIVRMDIRE